MCYSFSVAQDLKPDFFLKTGYGYFGNVSQFLDPGFGDVPPYVMINPEVEGKIQNGSMIWLDFSHRLNSGFTVGLNLTLADSRFSYNDGLGFYWDFKQTASYKIFDLSFGRELTAGGNGFTFSLGMLYRNYFSSFADYEIVPVLNQDPVISFPAIIESEFNDLGMSFKIDYTYTFKKHLLIGIRTGANLMFALGFENIILSPLIGMKF